MDFNKPIYGEVEGSVSADVAKEYFKNNGIAYIEQVEDGYYVGSFHIFTFPEMTQEQLNKANKYTDVVFYQ